MGPFWAAPPDPARLDRGAVEPSNLTANDWVRLSNLVANLWFLAIALIFTGLTYILAHGILPSLTYTGELSGDLARRARMPTYGLSLIGLLAVVALVVRGIVLALDVLPAVYGRMAI